MKHQFLSLLIALLTLHVVGSIINVAVINYLLFVWILTSGILATGKARYRIVVALSLALPTAALGILAASFHTISAFFLLFHGFVLAFLGYACVRVIRFIFERSEVSFDLIFASLAVYLLIGAFWAVLYSLVEFTMPGSFRVPDEGIGSMILGRGERSLNMYYSLVTLTTLGYGEITPVTPLARSLAALEAVLGPVYLAVLVAGLVGVRISQSMSQARSTEH